MRALRARPRPPTPLTRPRASPSASARCALRFCARHGGSASGRVLSSGRHTTEDRTKSICLFAPSLGGAREAAVLLKAEPVFSGSYCVSLPDMI